MASKTFIDYTTVVDAAWLNDVNQVVYNNLGGRDNIGTTAGSALIGTPPLAGVTGSTVAQQLSSLATSLASGGVTSVSVVTENGFQAIVDNPTTSATIHLGVTPVGILKGSGGSIVGAVNGTDYVDGAALALKSDIASPTFTGVPRVPTAAPGTNTTQAASTAFVTAAVVASTTGVSSVNGNTGAITAGQIATAATSGYGYTPATSVSPTFTGTPLLTTTPTAGDSSHKIADTAFVDTSFAKKASPTFTGTVTVPTVTPATTSDTRAASTAFVQAALAATPATVTATSIGNALCVDSSTKSWIWNNDISGHADAGDSHSLYIQRKATYSGGTAGKVNSALYLETYTPTNNTSYEWGLTSVLYSASAGTGGGASAVPQNVAVNGTTWKQGTAACWGGNFVVYDTQGVFSSTSGPSIGIEVNVGGNGTDNWQQTIGIDAAPQLVSGATSSSLFTAFRSSGSATSTWQHGFYALTGTTSSFTSTATGTYGMFLGGTYNVGIDLSTSTISSNVGIRLKSGQGIMFEATNNIYMNFDAATQRLQFINGSTPHGYIDMSGGANNDLALSGIVSFNGRAAVNAVLNTTDVTDALTFTPMRNDKLSLPSLGNVAATATPGPGAATPGTVNGFLIIEIDGSNFKIPFYNP